MKTRINRIKKKGIQTHILQNSACAAGTMSDYNDVYASSTYKGT